MEWVLFTSTSIQHLPITSRKGEWDIPVLRSCMSENSLFCPESWLIVWLGIEIQMEIFFPKNFKGGLLFNAVILMLLTVLVLGVPGSLSSILCMVPGVFLSGSCGTFYFFHVLMIHCVGPWWESILSNWKFVFFSCGKVFDLLLYDFLTSIFSVFSSWNLDNQILCFLEEPWLPYLFPFYLFVLHSRRHPQCYHSTLLIDLLLSAL